MISRIVIRSFRIFRDFTISPDPRLNIIVGDNEAGKSTLLEAVALGLSGRIDGRWANEELNPYWFNVDAVADFFRAYDADKTTAPPKIEIELYLESTESDVQRLRGIHNSHAEDVPGLRLHVGLNREYAVEFAAYMDAEDRPAVLPTEYFEASWRDFNDMPLRRRPVTLGMSVIDARTIRSRSGVDYHTREILGSFLEPAERAAISVAHRKVRDEMTRRDLEVLNSKLRDSSDEIHDATLSLAMDQSARASWESGVIPHVTSIPFAMAGQGQQASIKVALAMRRRADSARFVLIEEPETHLSYSRLHKLIDRIAELAGNDQQLFITTHSSFVLNRLGLGQLLLLHPSGIARISDLTDETVDYFRHLSGYDTLRLALASRLVLVEGPSDEMVFKRGYKDHFGRYPEVDGIDVVSMSGLTFKRALELCQALDRDVVALQDNDGNPVDELLAELGDLLSERRRMFIGDSNDGMTLEPQLLHANGVEHMRTVLGLRSQDNLLTWMPNHKTEGALRILESREMVTMPAYIQAAIESFA